MKCPYEQIPLTLKTAPKPLIASTTTVLPFPVWIRMLVLVGRRHHPLLFADPSSLANPKASRLVDRRSFPTTCIHHTAGALVTDRPLRGRGGLHGLTSPT